jgi:hypothetical protein
MGTGFLCPLRPAADVPNPDFWILLILKDCVNVNNYEIVQW